MIIKEGRVMSLGVNETFHANGSHCWVYLKGIEDDRRTRTMDLDIRCIPNELCCVGTLLIIALAARAKLFTRVK